jgi:hypothetical protein
LYRLLSGFLLIQYANNSNSIRQKIETAGKAMLKDMAENPETVTLECGVVFHPLEAGRDGFGKGVRPTAASTVKVHYHGDYIHKRSVSYHFYDPSSHCFLFYSQALFQTVQCSTRRLVEIQCHSH